jgi:hypothetical protein
VTQWGMLLLVAYIVLGATRRVTWRQAGGIGLALTIVVIAAALVSYSRSTPTDLYIPAIDSTIDQTGATLVPPLPGTGFITTEDHTGLKAANWFSTDHSPGAQVGSGGGGG